MQEENQGGNAASIRPDQIHTRRKIPRGEIYGRGTRQSSGSENPKSNKYMETRAPQDIPKKALDRKIKIMLLNSLIRCTVIYGMRTRDLPRHMVGKMEIYMFKQIGAMINPNWKTEAWYPGKNQLYKELQQSTMKSWLSKTQILTMLTQTQDNQMIHPIDCKAMLIPRIKLQQQRKRRNHAILEQPNIGK